MIKSSNEYTSELQLIIGSELKELLAASQNLNPFLTYVRFILTDSLPNGNGHIIPQEEFSNLIQTGLYMPLKMAQGEIKDGHEDAMPLGVITHLIVEGNKVRGVAALWNRERPADVAFIKERYANGEPLDLSWEIGFDPDESEYNEEGYLVLRGCVLRATTLVGIPAYDGRTTITDVDSSSDDSKEEETVTELEQLKERIVTLEAENEALKELQITDKQLEELAELEDLREFRNEIEAEAAKQEKIAAIRDSFKEAGVEKPETFFEANQDKLLALQESEMLDFFISNLIAEKSDDEEEDEEEIDVDEEEASEEEDLEEDSASKEKVPNFRSIKLPDSDKVYTPQELGKLLRQQRQSSKETK